ncbi:MAG: hypothetical protein NE334_09300 [Lentisphaeraceae bacterium]|nr:hypothetical protein [Lentisphaeraceae bacterium]
MSKAELLKQRINQALEDKEITLDEVRDVIKHLLPIDNFAKDNLEEIIADGRIDNSEQMEIRNIFQNLLER